ncbi:hypothetical protein HPT25_02145 [Bacillus sp. BRMEA1]|uniref:tetratricopeptide repeat protein n=1 Tax=Neobacillus endophyticus TaxID=2738405 RepID=UPI001563BB05|nr:tetratricopeptide repeat protein [Neobacillus endophyticus]NRD76286.1 hypothetical protein [Neobacillus endophyticus]
MKKIGVLILSALILSACTPQAYTENLDAGKTALEKGNYTSAIAKFEAALKDKQTDEAKNDLEIAKTLNDSLSLYHKGNFDKAIYSLTKLLNDNSSNKVEDKIINKANSLLKEIQNTKTLADAMQNKIFEGKTLLGENQYDQAIEVFKEVSETKKLTDIAPIKKMKKDAAELLDETAKMKNDADQQQSQQQQQQQQTQKNNATQVSQTTGNTNTQQPTSSNTALTTKQAEDLVKAQLSIQPDQNVKVEYDHNANNGDYIIHVYQFIVDNPSTGEGHSETMGWYGVNKQTKKIYNAIQ